MSNDIKDQVEQFLYRETRLLDERRFREWLELFTEDVRYFMAGRKNLYPKSSKGIKLLNPERYNDSDLPREDELALLDETSATLHGRIARLETGMAWSEDPPSRTRHIVTNIEVEPEESEAQVKAFSNFLVYRNRAETEQDFFIGARRDLLRRVDSTWKIARRKVILDQNVLLAKNVSIFF